MGSVVLEAVLPCLCPFPPPGSGNLLLQPVRHRELGLQNADSPSWRCVCQGNPAPNPSKARFVPSDPRLKSPMQSPGNLPCFFPRLCAAQVGNVGAQICELYVQIAHISSQSCSQEPEHSLLAASFQEDTDISCRHGKKPALFPIHEGWLQNNTEICHSIYVASVQIGLTA